jgi:hypothetical protein
VWDVPMRREHRSHCPNLHPLGLDLRQRFNSAERGLGYSWVRSRMPHPIPVTPSCGPSFRVADSNQSAGHVPVTGFFRCRRNLHNFRVKCDLGHNLRCR